MSESVRIGFGHFFAQAMASSIDFTSQIQKPASVLSVSGKGPGFTVRDLPSNKDASAIAGAIVSMGRSLGLRIIAEGVETSAQAAFLSGTDCEHAQGYLYSKPLPADEFAAWLIANRAATMAAGSLRLAHSA